MRPLTLSTRGELWTWTVQRFAPKSPPFDLGPDGFAPYPVGYVELPEGIRVEAIIDVETLGQLEIGLPVELVSAEGVPHFAPAPPSETFEELNLDAEA